MIYDNGTERDLLLRSLQKALDRDKAGRRIVELTAGILFSDISNEDDLASGTIYVLRSKSEHPVIQENREVIHKIGVTGGNVDARISSAKLDPTFLMANVEIVASYELYNINRSKLEGLIHKFFAQAKLDIEINDRFGNPVIPKEWFLVPLFVIDEVVEKIKDGTIGKYSYDMESAMLVCTGSSPQPCMIKFNEILQRDQVSFIRLLGGRPSLRTGYLARACFVDWPPPYSPIPWSIQGLEPAYTRKVGACAGSGTSE